MEDRGWLVGQARMTAGNGTCASDPTTSGCQSGASTAASGSALATQTATTFAHRMRLRLLLTESWRLGRRITAYFLAYTAVGYLLIELIPTGFLVELLGTERP